MPTVYLVQRPHQDIDLSSAEEFGRIDYVFGDNRFQPSQQPGVARRRMERFVKDFNPDTDYIVAKGGDPIGPVLVGMAMNRYFPGKEIKILRWERLRGDNGQVIPGKGFYTPSRLEI